MPAWKDGFLRIDHPSFKDEARPPHPQCPVALLSATSEGEAGAFVGRALVFFPLSVLTRIPVQPCFSVVFSSGEGGWRRPHRAHLFSRSLLFRLFPSPLCDYETFS